MRRNRLLKVAGVSVGVLVIAGLGISFGLRQATQSDPFLTTYVDNCGVCHGEALEGSAQGPALVGRPLTHGESVAELVQSIGTGFPDRGMPGWSGVFDEGMVRSLAILVAEQRVNRTMTDLKTDKVVVIPEAPIDSEAARFRVEVVSSGLAPKPFSIAPMNDGSLLLTEKLEGLSVIAPDGTRSEPITGTPATATGGFEVMGLDYGLGWLLDVKPHPAYADNGWIYLLHTHVCETCDGSGLEDWVPKTMTRLVRGRIDDGAWVDEEIVWSVPERFYSSMPDLGAGGRLTFDKDGHVFFSIGMKGGYFEGIQDLSTPYGKIHRVHDDGRVPEDNPFAQRPEAMGSIWTYGHRSPQGLEYEPERDELWGTEMGPRGGDEVNHLEPGRNYGWPLYSLGVDYDGTPVEYWKDLGIEFDLDEIEQPVVDLTPSPAVSSFVIYDGEAFPGWQGHFIVGSLKATELHRFVIEGDKLMHRELLIGDLSRIRDVEADADGMIYLLLEHASGSQIVRLVPAPAGDAVAAVP